MEPKSFASRLIALVILGAIPIVALTGCVSARNQMVTSNRTGPVGLNLTTRQPPVEATVKSLIVYHGSGSWKRDAYWDEYTVEIVNPGDAPLTLESARLTDFRGESTMPGDNPRLLEKQSLTFEKEFNRRAREVLVQIGGGYLAVGMAGSAMFLSGIACTTASTVMFAGIIPVYAAGTIYANVNGRREIEKEFQRRRLVLPQTLAAGRSVQGSLFFRISPGPQHLALHGHTGSEPFDLTIDLTPLGPLHIKPAKLAAKD